MVMFDEAIDVAQHAKEGGSNVLIPEGDYSAMIVNSEEKGTSSGGKMIVFTFLINQGQYANTEIVEMVNYINVNPKAQEIAYQTLANMGKAIGLATVSSSEQLHGKPMMIKVKNQKQSDWVNNNGETVAGTDKSVIKGFKAAPSSGESMQSSSPVQQQQQQAAAPFAPQQQTQQVAAPAQPSINPFSAG